LLDRSKDLWESVPSFFLSFRTENSPPKTPVLMGSDWSLRYPTPFDPAW
jgi:hypothetical protein